MDYENYNDFEKSKISNSKRERRKLDLLILDDSELFSEACLNLGESKFHLNIISFLSGVDTINYLNSITQINQIPAIMSDMNLRGNIIESKAPENLFYLYKQKGGDLDYFTYMTGHLSTDNSFQSDINVIERTNANYIVGKNIFDLNLFLKKVVKRKIKLIPKEKFGQRKNDNLLSRFFEEFKSKENYNYG